MISKKKIFLVLFVLALAQLACSLPSVGSTVDTPEALPTATSGPLVITATPAVPTPTRQPAPTKTAGDSAQTCTYVASFITDVTIPDDTRLDPGASFTKTWRVRNDGTCTWGPNQPLRALVFTGGSRLGAPEQMNLPGAVPPGQTVDLSVTMVAPAGNGVYTSEWKFRVENGAGSPALLGLGPDKSGPLYTRIVVGNAPTAAPQVARINFPAGGTDVTVGGTLKAGETRSYLLGAAKGQYLMSSYSSPASDLRMKITDLSTGKVFVSIEGLQTTVELPSTGDYRLDILNGSQDTNFTLGIIIPGRITFAAGDNKAVREGRITNRQAGFFSVRAQAGQRLSVKVSAASSAQVGLTIYGLADGQPLVRADFGLTEWSDILNVTQDYIIMVVPNVESTSYRLEVTLQ